MLRIRIKPKFQALPITYILTLIPYHTEQMPSNQESAGAGKAAKFVAANPLGPMADPFAGMVSILI